MSRDETSAGQIISAPRVHFYAIDLARGLASLSILFWHYQHFIVGGYDGRPRTAYPLYRLLWPLYDEGGLAVHFFFIVSGFVFCAVYAGAAATTREFVMHRIARLYPLHMVTFFCVAALQWACRQKFGHDLVYTSHSLTDVALQLVMGSGWGVTPDKSFNGPVWSVSAEVLVYGLFWLNRGWLLRWGPLVPLALSAAGFAVKSWQVGNCAGYFFLGSALFWLHRHRRVAGPVGLGLLGGMVAAAGQHAMGLAYLMGFCSAVLLLAEADHNGWGRHARRIPWIADNCYGSYLWHFPLQLVAFLLLGGPGSTLYWSPWVLLAYVAGVTLLARASFLYIERPARNALRQWAVARRAPSAPAGDELPLPAPR